MLYLLIMSALANKVFHQAEVKVLRKGSSHIHTQFYLGCCGELSEIQEHISELCHCRLHSCEPHCNQRRRRKRRHCKSLTRTEQQWQLKLEDRGGCQRAEGKKEREMVMLVCFTSKHTVHFLSSVFCCPYSLTMSVICGVFVRQTQIIETQEVLLFSCSTIETHWSSAAGTKYIFSYKDAKQQTVFFFILFYCVFYQWCLDPVESDQL